MYIKAFTVKNRVAGIIFMRKDYTMEKIKFAKIRKFLKGKGFAGALCLSITAVAIASYIAYDSSIKQITSQESSAPTSSQSETESSAAAVDKNQSGIEKEESSEEQSDAETNNFVSNTAKRIMPVEGEIIWEYSNGELVKSETLGVWKTHDGIDIAAPLGTAVKAAAPGTVSQIKDDALWGVCVVIDHGDGYTTHYFGLDKALEVKQGTEVEAGTVIGKTGEFDCESKLEPHLHFGVKSSDKWINPTEFINS